MYRIEAHDGLSLLTHSCGQYHLIIDRSLWYYVSTERKNEELFFKTEILETNYIYKTRMSNLLRETLRLINSMIFFH